MLLGTEELQSHICGMHGAQTVLGMMETCVQYNFFHFTCLPYYFQSSSCKRRSQHQTACPNPNTEFLCNMYMLAHYFPQVLCIFSAQKRSARRISGCLLVLFFSLFPEQPHELLAHTIQTLLSKQLLFSSWALLYCSLLQYLNASQILRYLFLCHSPGHAITPLY